MGREILLVGPMRLEASFKASSFDRLVAVDGGLRHFKSVLPDLAVGDWDSFGRTPRPDYAKVIVSLDSRKNVSDLGAALRAVVETMNPTAITLVGFSGGRIDHERAVESELAILVSRRSLNLKRVRLARPNGWTQDFLGPSCRKWRESGLKLGTEISILPMSSRVASITTAGLEYPLKNEALALGSRGLSNRAVSKQVSVSTSKSGVLCVFGRTMATSKGKSKAGF